jgi:hypothetical protein
MEETSLEIDKVEEPVVEIPENLTIASTVPVEEVQEPSETPGPTGKIFIGEEDRRLLKKFNGYIVKKLGVGGNRSFKI